MLSNQAETIYVALLDEGTDVWRPVQAELCGAGHFRIVSANPDPQDERWEFPSGAVVRCERRKLSGGYCLVAAALVEV
jgi:hypothetical protein